jgi:hypothetical protein
MNFIYHVCVELIVAGMVVSVGVCVCVCAVYLWTQHKSVFYFVG